MELYELEILKLNSLHQKSACGIAVALRRARCLAEHHILSARRYYYRISRYGLESSRSFVKDQGAAALPVFNKRTVEIRPEPALYEPLAL